MTAPTTAPRRRAWLRYLLILIVSGLLCLVFGLWYITTDSFQNLVRRRMVAEVERITGGRAEIGSFHTIPFRMQVDVRDITVHGREGAGDVPLAHAERLVAHVKIISLLRSEFGFHSLVLERPVVHIEFYPDGTTNVPAPAVQGTSTKSLAEQIFALSIDRFDVRHGELLWDDQALPLDFAVHDAVLQMQYSFLRSRYESRLLLGKVDTKFDGFRPFAWMTTADFSLGTNLVDIKSLRLDSGRSHIEASGRITNFREPHVDATYDAHFDLGEAASITRRHDVREGVAEFKGKGSWSLDQFTSSGVLAVRDLSWLDDQFSLKKAAVTSDYTVTDQQIKLSKLQGKLLGGGFTGDAQIDNWLRSIPPPPQKSDDIAIITAARPKPKNQKLPGVQNGAIHLRVRDVSADEVAAALNTRAHPLSGFHPAGSAGGSLDANWRGSARDAQVAFAIDLTPPARNPAGSLPVTGRAQGIYRAGSDSLELSAFNLTTPGSRIQAAGTLSSASSLRFSFSTSSLGEWRPLIASLGGPADLPFAVKGNATFTGVVSGKLAAPSIAGTLTAQDFDFTLPASARTPEQQVHWDSLSASIQVSPRNLALRGGTLLRGETSAEFELTAGLEKGQFTPSSPFTARINLHHVDVASTAALAGYDYPVTGTADLSLEAGGTRSHPQAQGQIHATNASVYGESISGLDADLRAGEGETALTNIRLLHDDATVTGSAAYDPSTQSFKVDLVGNNFDLAQIRQIQSDRMPIEGRGDFTLQASGTRASPAINATAHLRDLTLDRELAGTLDLQAVSKGGEMHVSGHSGFARGAFVLDGNVQMRDGFPANLSVRMDHLDVDALWHSYLSGQLTGHSAIGGTVNMQGPLRDPGQWVIGGNLNDVVLDVDYAKLHNQDPVRFSFSGKSFRMEQMHMVGEGTDLTARGSVNFSGAREVDLTAEGHIDLKLLNGFDPDLSASGLMTMNMTVGGTISDPLPQGKLQVSNAAVTYAGLPSGLSGMNGSLDFTRDRVHIDSLTARSGGGTLDLKGDATNYNHVLSFNFTATGNDVRLRYPPGVSSTANGELHWVGTRSASTVSGDVMVTKLAVTPNFDFGSYLERSRQITSITPANSPLYNVKLDIHVQTSPELQMKTAVVRLSGDADLRLRGSVARPTVLGRADILEGEATFNGTKFRLERGDITFADPVTIRPQLNLQASTHVRNYDLDITVTGTPDNLAVNYRSEPPLPKSDIITLLALGRTSAESESLQQTSGQSAFTDEASALIINQAINSTVSNRMQKLFGVSRIKIDPQGLTTETNPTARGPQVTIEQQFANNITLTYSTNVAQSTQQIIQGEYYFTRNISMVGTRDQNGVVSFDVRIRRQKK